MTDEDSRIREVLGTIGRTAATHRKAVIAAAILFVGIALVGAAGVQMSLGMELYVDEQSETQENWDEIQQDFNKGNVIYVRFDTGNETNLTSPEMIRTLDQLNQSYYAEIDSAALVTSPAHPVKAGLGYIPDTQEEIVASVNHSFNEQRSNMGVITNLYPDIQDDPRYVAPPPEMNQSAFPIAVENGTEMFANASTGVAIIQYGNVDIPDDRAGDFFGLLPPSEDEIVEEQVREITQNADIPEDVDVTVTGTPVFEQAAFNMMLGDMVVLFGAALAIILVLVILIMRGRLRRTRDVAMPLVMALVAMVYMLGMMGYVGFDFNAIMLGVMPIALGLTIDYGLQIQTRYEEERQAGVPPREAAETAATTTGWALAVVFGTTAVGLGSLLIADVPPVRQFGATVAFSVLTALILSITFLVALLVAFDPDDDNGGTDSPAPGTDTSTLGPDEPADGQRQPTGLERGFGIVSSLVSARTLLVVLILGSGVAAGVAAYPAVDTKTDMLDYWPDIQERQDIRDLEERVASPNINYMIIENTNDEGMYNREAFEEVRAFQQRVEQHEDVVAVMSTPRAFEVGMATPPVRGPASDRYPPTAAGFESQLDLRTRIDRPPQLGLTPDQHPDRLIVQLFIKDIEGQAEREVIDYSKDSAAATLPDDMTARTTGEMVLNRNVIENVTSGLVQTTILSFVLGMLFLGVVLRSGRESVLLIGSVAGSALALTAGGMYLLDIPWNPLTVTTGAIILGIGIDYAVHIYERFREERGQGAGSEAAIRTALIQKSRPVLGSGATTMFGFGVLAISAFPVLSNFGLAIGLAMGMSMLTAFVFMPALTLALDRRGYLPVGESTTAEPAD